MREHNGGPAGGGGREGGGGETHDGQRVEECCHREINGSRERERVSVWRKKSEERNGIVMCCVCGDEDEVGGLVK